MGMDLYNSLLAAKLADGGDFSPTTAQLAAMNSGITAERLQADEDNILSIINRGSKNRLLNQLENKTESYVTLTRNSDRTVTVSTSQAASAQVVGKLISAAGNYAENKYGGMILSGAPTGASTDGYYIYMAYSNNGTSQAGSSVSISAGEAKKISSDYPYIMISILVKSGTNIPTPVTFQPMICTEEDWNASQKYESYTMTIQEITDWILSQS